MKIVFKKTELIVELLNYQNNNRIAIELTEVETGEPYMVASVNLVEEELKDNEIIIKNYSENEGILECLIKNGVVSVPTRHIMQNYAVCNLLINHND